MMCEVFNHLLCVLLAAAGSAGDRLGHGEESDGASACCHPAAGELLPVVFPHSRFRNTYLYDA